MRCSENVACVAMRGAGGLPHGDRMYENGLKLVSKRVRERHKNMPYEYCRKHCAEDDCNGCIRKSYPQKPGDPRDITDNKSYPSRAPGKGLSTDNLALWVFGVGAIGGRIRDRAEEIESEISEIESKIRRYHTKNVKGHEYWYFVQDGSWTFVGKEDPRGALTKKQQELEASIQKIKSEMRSCIVKQVKEHLVVDVALFKKNIAAKLPSDVILLSEMVKK